MASIGKDPNGLRRILFMAGDGKRRTIRIGKATQRQAEAFKVKVESLVTAAITGGADDETSRWLAGLDDTITAKLAAVGLTKARERNATTLARFLDDYIAEMTVKPATRTFYGHTRRNLVDFFGEKHALRNIEPADGDRWREHLKGSGLSESTIARRVVVARQLFKRAVKWKLIAENPFADVKAGSQTNKARQFFITRQAAQQVLDACPDAQWRLLFALSRYGGLRCPSEHLALTWGDVDWERNRLRVPSCKTEHHEGKDARFIPLFAELKQYLLAVFDEAEPGVNHVITRYRSTNVNLRTQLQRIMKRAGVPSWPKLFHNLRSTRETELAEDHPMHVVCAWLGNSRRVAQDHYLQVTDEHFRRAANESGTRAAQNLAQQASASASMDRKSATIDAQNESVLPSGADACGNMPNENWARQDSNL